MARDLAHFSKKRDKAFDRFFCSILEAEPVRAVLAEYQEARKKWTEERGHDRTWFEKVNEMTTDDFARGTAAIVAAHLGLKV
jgi:hypothetical protein